VQSYAGMALVLLGVSLNIWYKHRVDQVVADNG
jgi:hypothetical protein